MPSEITKFAFIAHSFYHSLSLLTLFCSPHLSTGRYEASVSREIAVLRVMSHPGIARMVAHFRWRDGAYLVLEHAAKGDLHTYIAVNGSLDAPSCRFVAGEILAALEHVMPAQCNAMHATKHGGGGVVVGCDLG